VILAVDDDPQVLGLYTRYLTPHDCRVTPLTDSRQTVEVAEKLQPCSILLDTTLPDKDGWQVLQELKNCETTRSIPVILCTIDPDQQRGLTLGAADYLVKPILESDLVYALNRILGDGSL
jgi:DNA-binding response OmpR family regulator